MLFNYIKETRHIPTITRYNGGWLKTVTGLFDQVQLDASRTCIYWNDEIDLPSDILYEYGKQIS